MDLWEYGHGRIPISVLIDREHVAVPFDQRHRCLALRASHLSAEAAVDDQLPYGMASYAILMYRQAC